MTKVISNQVRKQSNSHHYKYECFDVILNFDQIELPLRSKKKMINSFFVLNVITTRKKLDKKTPVYQTKKWEKGNTNECLLLDRSNSSSQKHSRQIKSSETDFQVKGCSRRMFWLIWPPSFNW